MYAQGARGHADLITGKITFALANPVRWTVLFPFYRWRNRSLQRSAGVLVRSPCEEVAELGFEPIPLCPQRLQAQTIVLAGRRLFRLWTACRMT